MFSSALICRSLRSDVKSAFRSASKIFYQHDFFVDDKDADDTYAVLSDIYGALSQDSKDKLIECYSMFKKVPKGGS